MLKGKKRWNLKLNDATKGMRMMQCVFCLTTSLWAYLDPKVNFFYLEFFLDSINGFLTLERKDLKKFSSIQIRTLSIIKIITVFICTILPPPGFLCEILYHDFTSLTQLPCRQKSQWYILLANSWTSYPVNTIQL